MKTSSLDFDYLESLCMLEKESASFESMYKMAVDRGPDEFGAILADEYVCLKKSR